jgi:hypothetical protein
VHAVLRRPLALVALVLAACGGERVLAGVEVPVGYVRLLLDGAPAGVVAIAGHGPRRPLLDALPPELAATRARWIAVEARARDGRRLAIPEPTGRYRDHAGFLYATPAGAPALGWWRERAGRAEQERPRFALEGVASITFRTAPPAPAAPPDVAVTLDGAAAPALAGRALLGLAAVEAADDGEGGGGRRGKRGGRAWRLADVVALAAPLETLAAIVVVGAEGRAELDPAGLDGVVLKFSARGDLNLRGGDVGKVRGVTRLELRRR